MTLFAFQPIATKDIEITVNGHADGGQIGDDTEATGEVWEDANGTPNRVSEVTGDNLAVTFNDGSTFGENGISLNQVEVVGYNGTPTFDDTKNKSTDDALASGDNQYQGEYGILTLDPVTGNWTYDLQDGYDATNALKQGDQVTETFTINVYDANDYDVNGDLIAGATPIATKDIEITVNGHADGGQIGATKDSDTSNNDVYEDANGTPNRAQDRATGGLINITYADGSNDGWTLTTLAFNGLLQGTYGSWTVVGGQWTYTVDDSLAATNALKQNTTMTETLVVTLTDPNDSTNKVSDTITVTVHGHADGRTILNDDNVGTDLTPSSAPLTSDSDLIQFTTTGTSDPALNITSQTKASSTVSGYDKLSGYDTSKALGIGDLLDLNSTTIAPNVSKTDGTNSFKFDNNTTITHHTIVNGEVSFYDLNTLLSIDTGAKLAAAVQYLGLGTNLTIGQTVEFSTSGSSVGANTYVFQKGASVATSTFIELTGLSDLQVQGIEVGLVNDSYIHIT